MAPDAARRATEHEFPPACPFCNRHDRVEPLAVSDLSPGVQDLPLRALRVCMGDARDR